MLSSTVDARVYSDIRLKHEVQKHLIYKNQCGFCGQWTCTLASSVEIYTKLIVYEKITIIVLKYINIIFF